MNAMWITLITRYGIPFAYQLWQDWRTKADPTEEDWQRLLALSAKTAAQYKEEAKPASQAEAEATGHA
jgi:hypothetical protein